ncbi:MAG: hypothetical protein MI749_10350 [Desulfovibrionales bacterium]|nr:hypothetical protein [Desulfovibrionales bacterium]
MCSVVGDMVSLVTGQMSARAQQKAQAKAYEYNARVAQRQAELARRKGQQDIQKERNAFAIASGKSQSMLASGNVDLSSGSALDMLVSNREKASNRIATAAYNAERAASEYEQRGAVLTAQSEDATERAASYDPLFVVQGTSKAYSLFS